MADESKEINNVVSSAVNNSESNSSPTTLMRDSDIKWRAKYKMAKEELETIKLTNEKETKAINEMLNKISSERDNTKQKYIEAKIESIAVSLGITDIDIVKLIKKDGISIDNNGDIVGVLETVQSFKQEKPHFFGNEKKVSSSTNAAAITDSVVKPRKASDFSQKEFDIIKKQISAGSYKF